MMDDVRHDKGITHALEVTGGLLKGKWPNLTWTLLSTLLGFCQSYLAILTLIKDHLYSKGTVVYLNRFSMGLVLLLLSSVGKPRLLFFFFFCSKFLLKFILLH